MGVEVIKVSSYINVKCKVNRALYIFLNHRFTRITDDQNIRFFFISNVILKSNCTLLCQIKNNNKLGLLDITRIGDPCCIFAVIAYNNNYLCKS